MKITKKICFIACFVALFILLDRISILIPGINVRITSRNLPLYIGAYIYGPIIGMTIGIVGMLVSQINYPMDLMWILFLIPQGVVGFLTGICAKFKILDFNNKKIKYFIVLMILNLTLSILNTIFIFIRYIYYGANLDASIVKTLTEIPFRLIGSIITSIIYAVIMPYIIKIIKPIFDK